LNGGKKETMKKIMIVDDQEDFIFSIKVSLEATFGEKYQVIPAYSGRQCFDILAKQEMPDLILLDIMMPKMNGWEVFDTLRENPNWQHIPIVFMTALTDPVSKKAGHYKADDENIIKPVDNITELSNRIDKILAKKNDSRTSI
jgi:CheY-like chemotaxis protein